MQTVMTESVGNAETFICGSHGGVEGGRVMTESVGNAETFICGSHGGGGGGTVICRLLGVKIGVGNVQKNTVNYRKNCFLRMFAGMRSRKKKRVFPAWELNF